MSWSLLGVQSVSGIVGMCSVLGGVCGQQPADSPNREWFMDKVRSREEGPVEESTSDKYDSLVSEGRYIFCSFSWVYVLISLCAFAKCSHTPGKRWAALLAAQELQTLPWALLSPALTRTSHDISALRKLIQPWEDDPRSFSLGNWSEL